MASLSIATPFALIAGSKGQKMSRLMCRASSASPAKNQVNCLQSLSSRHLSFSPAEDATEEEANAAQEASEEAEPAPPRRLSKPVIFTEEKARILRKATREGKTFHDKWYHSAIASRLAFPA